MEEEWRFGLLKKGITAIVPNITSEYTINNAISAHAALYGYTLSGIMVQIVLACTQYLQMTYKDLSHIGLSGISNGGFLALLAAALDRRFSFLLVSGMLSSPYDRILKHRKLENAHEYSYYFQGPFWMEFDIVQLAMLVIPRIIVFEVGKDDNIVKNGWEKDYSQLRDLYQKLNLSSRLGVVVHDGQWKYSFYLLFKLNTL